MTMVALTALAVAASFVVGFLLGDRRGVKQANAILDENWRELMQAIREDGLPQPAEREETVTQVTIH